MLPGYYASTRRSSANTPPVSYVSSPTDSSHNSTSTHRSNDRGTSVVVSPAQAMSTSVTSSPAGTPLVHIHFQIW